MKQCAKLSGVEHRIYDGIGCRLLKAVDMETCFVRMKFPRRAGELCLSYLRGGHWCGVKNFEVFLQ
jgi:hypothetical protein